MALCVAFAAFGPRHPRLASAGGAGRGADPRIGTVIDHVAEAQPVATTYLAAYPDEADRAVLVASLERAHSGWRDPPDDPDRLREFVRARIRDDYRAGRMVSIDGWFVARTSARLCALLTLA